MFSAKVHLKPLNESDAVHKLRVEFGFVLDVSNVVVASSAKCMELYQSRYGLEFGVCVAQRSSLLSGHYLKVNYTE